MTDAWSSGAAYEPYMGRWSQLVAHEVLHRLAIPAQSRWVDVGCGTGALTRTILAEQHPAQVVGVDHAEAYLNYAREQWNDPRVQWHVGDAEYLPLANQEWDVAVAGLVLNFVPHPVQAVAEMRRVVRPHGTVAAYIWDYAGQMQLVRFFWNAVVALHPHDQALDEGSRFPLCQPDRLCDLWHEGGLSDVEATSIEVPTLFANFDAYWQPFLSGQGPAPGYCMQLAEEARQELR